MLLPEAAPGFEQCSVSSARILLVEDNSTNCLLLRDYLTHLGHNVMTLVSGSGFFTALAQFRPHLVLLDLKLPDVDGYTILQQLRQSSDWSNLPVVVISAYAFNLDQQRALMLGARDYLVKPIDLNALHKTINEYLC
jgi:CheY-like chemotaxis protein